MELHKKRWWKSNSKLPVSFIVFFMVLAGVGLAILAGAFLWANYKNGHLTWGNDGIFAINKPANQTDCPDYLCTSSISPVQEKLPHCVGTNYLTSSPIDVDKLERITPLGLIHPPGHALPMDHMLLNYPSSRTDIKIPGAVHIFGIRQTILKQNNEVTWKMYSVAFSPCKELTFYFEGMAELSDALQKEVGEFTCETSQKEGNREYIHCTHHSDYATSAGEVIGTGGGPDSASHTLDFGSYDKRVPRLPFIRRGDEGPNSDVFYTTCPLDYYSSPLKHQLYDKLTRAVEPRCGEIMQDKLGTIQGNWQAKKEFRTEGTWSPFLGIGHNTNEPSIAVFGVGGTISDVGIISFIPQHAGTVNREPSEVTADGQVYCYQYDKTPPWSGDPELLGRIILQLLDAKTLKIEHQEKRCEEEIHFSSPTLYER